MTIKQYIAQVLSEFTAPATVEFDIGVAVVWDRNIAGTTATLKVDPTSANHIRFSMEVK